MKKICNFFLFSFLICCFPCLGQNIGPFANAIWQPQPGTSWQWQLTGVIDPSLDVKMYDIDLFDTPQSTINLLHTQGKAVVCYFSAGSFEGWRPDARDFPQVIKGRKMDNWNELWLDIRQLDVLKKIMGVRMDLAVAKGCQGVEPDNVDGYTNKTGFPLTAKHQLAYNKMLAEEAHRRGLSVGLKNDVDQIKQLLPYFDWALNEECFKYNECENYKLFIKANKAVFGVEYGGNQSVVCAKSNSMNFDWLFKRLDLDAYRRPCR